MKLREIRLPDDLVTVMNAAAVIFQYPDHPEWSMQPDEQAQMTEGMRNIRRMWPVFRMLQPFSSQLRDILRGFVWEDKGAVVGIATAQKLDTTQTWLIGAVGLLPEYRGKSLASKMLRATLDLVQSRGGKRVRLGMFATNHPARALYDRMGFEEYDGSIGFTMEPQKVVAPPVLPDGYESLPLGRFEWRPRLALDQRISPQRLQKYEPLVEARYREPLAIRAIVPLILRAQGIRDETLAIRVRGTQEIVAWTGCDAIVRRSGPNSIRARIDPAHPQLAAYALQYALHRATALAPDKRITFAARTWMPDLLAAADVLGLERKTESLSLGLTL